MVTRSLISQPCNVTTRQDGAALLVSLIILLVMTVLAIASMQSTSLQEKMVAAQRDAQIALEGAENAVTQAEGILSSGTIPTISETNGWYNADDDDVPTTAADLLASATWLGNGSVQANKPSTGGSSELKENPRYLVQRLDIEAVSSGQQGGPSLNADSGYGAGDDVELSATVYRVVGYSTGATGQTPRAVEAYFKRQN